MTPFDKKFVPLAFRLLQKFGTLGTFLLECQLSYDTTLLKGGLADFSGTLTNPISDTDASILVTVSSGKPVDKSYKDVLRGHNRVSIGAETIAYETAVEGPPGIWTLSGVLRARNNTTAISHSAGEAVSHVATNETHTVKVIPPFEHSRIFMREDTTEDDKIMTGFATKNTSFIPKNGTKLTIGQDVYRVTDVNAIQSGDEIPLYLLTLN